MSGRRGGAQGIVLGALGLTALTLGLQYIQHVREGRLVGAQVRMEHSTEFSAPTLTGAKVFGASGLPSEALEAKSIALDARLGKMERALAWLEGRPKDAAPILAANAIPQALAPLLPQSLAMGVAGAASTPDDEASRDEKQAPKKRPKVDTTSTTKLKTRNHEAKKRETAKEKRQEMVHRREEASKLPEPLPPPVGAPKPAMLPGGIITDDPFLLQRILQVGGPGPTSRGVAGYARSLHRWCRRVVVTWWPFRWCAWKM